ncbi:MAG TPA: serine dehydratase subunit alpha family protein [Spirochaetes bacterium]|mgnify:CR=1 FL=1|nr:serine dehydratase subunit alpha family protein [Spirochaetota bacterium]
MAYTVKDVLAIEVAPALGCTEPSAVALSAAAAASLLPEKTIDSVEVWLDPNIYKNALGVAIPGTRGEYGIELAAALGAFSGDPSLGLEVFQPIDDQAIAQAREFVKNHNVTIHLMEDQKGIYIRTLVTAGSRRAEGLVEGSHDNITRLSLDGETVTENPLISRSAGTKNRLAGLEEWLSRLSLEELIALLDELDDEDLEFIQEGIRCNTTLAEYGLKYGPGLGIGCALGRLVSEGLLKKDMILAARILTSAASDARMAGVKLPAMSSAGSGNHGLTAILPIWAVRDYITCDDETRVLRAIALSHILTAYIKAHTGRLSAVCGCSVAAGAGAAGGITYLMNGTIHHIAGAITNLIEDLAGVICDGAKAGCSLKLATAAGTAVQSALFALHGIDVKSTDGIVASTPEQTMKNVGELSTKGMIETDRTILQIMIKKRFDV